MGVGAKTLHIADQIIGSPRKILAYMAEFFLVEGAVEECSRYSVLYSPINLV